MVGNMIPLVIGNMIAAGGWQPARLKHAVSNLVIIDGWQHDGHWRLAA
jgi:hypothetical protein